MTHLTRRAREAFRRHRAELQRQFFARALVTARLGVGLQRDGVARFDALIADPLLEQVAGRLATFAHRGPAVTPARYPKLDEIQRAVARVVGQGGTALRDQVGRGVVALARNEVGWLQGVLRPVLQVQGGPGPAPAVLRRAVETRPFLGRPAEQWFGEMLQAPVRAAVQARVQSGIQAGETTEQIVRGLQGRAEVNYADGVLQKGRVALRAFVGAAATHASTQARDLTFRDLGLDRVRFVATLDDRTCPVCGQFDGQVFGIDEGPRPPLHPGCRCTVLPDLGEPLGTRASVGGVEGEDGEVTAKGAQVPADLRFPEWLAQQPREWQDRALGKTRAAAWRAGRLSFRRMVGPDLQPLTLAELADLGDI